MKNIFVSLLLILITQSLWADYIANDIIGGCDSQTLQIVNNTVYLEPVFVPNEYTCSADNFLPANTTGCRPCPNGYTCSGGTFLFNKTSAQGITPKDTITANAQYICSDNVLETFENTAYLEPVFAPKTVTVNWDDGNGGTPTQTTCNYDGLVTLPPEPTRPGYTFSGWKLDTNNNQ